MDKFKDKIQNKFEDKGKHNFEGKRVQKKITLRIKLLVEIEEKV